MAQLSDAQNARLRAAMEAWLAEHPDKKPSHLADFIGRSQPSISEILRGKSGASMATAELFAEKIGQPVYAVIGQRGEQNPNVLYELGMLLGLGDGDLHATQLVLPRTLPGWAKAESAARKLRPHLDWAIRGARTMPISMPPRKVTAAIVLRLARLFRDGASPAAKKRAVDDELADREQEGPQRVSDRPSVVTPTLSVKKA